MVEASFESLVENVTSVVRTEHPAALSLDAALAVTLKKQSEREVVLSALVRGEKISQAARDWLIVFDVVAAASAVAIGDKGKGALSATPFGSEVTDLWIKATAGRALWFERFARYPKEDPQKKEEALHSTAKEVGGSALSLAVRLGIQPAQFTAFVASLAGSKTC